MRRAALAGDAVALRAIAHKMVPIYTLLGEEELAAALRRLERSEGSADGALRSAALGVAERVGEIVRTAFPPPLQRRKSSSEAIILSLKMKV